MKKAILSTIVLLLISTTAYAHTLYMSVETNDDGTALARGMFSTGATAAGLDFRLEDENEKIILKGKMDEFGEYTFKIPDSEYYVVIDGGPGHTVKEEGPKK